MKDDILDIKKLLENCEKPGINEYVTSLKINFENRELYVISDLHIAGGKRKDGNYTGTENFFADESIKRFLSFIDRSSARAKTLIINGDLFDFLRIEYVPKTEEDFTGWLNLLTKLGIHKTIEDLQKSISPKEIKYGLKTNDYKSAWKLLFISEGHPKFFEALADWLANNNQVIIIKGNHDLEFIYPLIRNCFRYLLAETMLGKQNSGNLYQNLNDYIIPNLVFIDHSLLINEEVYLEHGHRFDRYSNVVGSAFYKDTQELNIPFGSFFNRYLLNKIEYHYPYIDNVRPRENILPVIFREKFFMGLSLLFRHIPFMIKIIPKKYYWYMFSRVIWFFLALIIPLGLAFWQIYEVVKPYFLNEPKENLTLLDYIWNQGKSFLGSFSITFFSYLLSRFVAWFQLEEPNSLSEFALKVFSHNTDYKYLIMGHTHNPEQQRFSATSKIKTSQCNFYNTGTWIPIISYTMGEVREVNSYCFLKVVIENGEPSAEGLKLWNDFACRVDPSVTINSKVFKT